ncbi:TonB-dependent receptor [Croceivirga sp. JEA036]|uniref:TonB-dependent receptor n=1 Tax=Croceivirga sp. JEA036 TaxID=2721162 RepID=UPI001FD798CB|nr:TonB-dependent receptor [Croceivirga sp. JEA036]
MRRILHRRLPFLLGVLVFFLPIYLSAQDSTTIGLKEYIAKIEQAFEIKISYADEDAAGKTISFSSLEDLKTALSSIELQTGLTIKSISERYYSLYYPNTIAICGKVLDNFAANTIPGATVAVLGTDIALVTDTNGVFNISNAPRDASLQIRYLGFQTKVVPVSNFIGKECPKVLLSEQREQLEEVIVYQFLTPGLVKETDGSFSLNTGELGILPGLIEPDVLQSIQALPGIESVDETVSDINVRGGTNDQNLILWNGIKMYQSGHFFGLISAFNPYLTDKVTIYKNGTPAQYGDGVSSVISMQTQDEIGYTATGGAGFNLISGDVYAHLPLSDNFALQFSARRSTTDFLNTPIYGSFTDRVFQDTEIKNEDNESVDNFIETAENFAFFDVSAKLLYNINPDHKLRLSLIGIDNDLDFIETNTDNNTSSQSFLDQTNVSAGLQYQGQWNNKLTTTANAYFSQYTLDAQNILNNNQQLFQKNRVEERAAKFNINYALSDAWQWQNGFQYIETGITNLSDVTQPPFQSNIIEVIRTFAPYSSFTYTAFENKLIATGGLRANYIINLDTFGADFKTWLLEPRLNLNFKLANFLRAQVMGEFKSQTTNQVIDLEQNFLGIEKRRWTLSNQENLPLTQSKQASAGIVYEKNGFHAGVEAFYKEVDGVSTRTQGFQNQDQFNGEIGLYKIKGIELLLNKKGENYSSWLSYTYNKNDYTFDSIVPARFPNNLDVRHNITLASTYTLGNLKLGLGLNYRTGKPYTEPDAENSIDNTVFPSKINYAAPNSSRLPEYLRLDGSATYSFKISNSIKADTGISLLNMTNRKNLLNKYYRINEDEEIQSIERISLGITPNASFRIRF